MDIHKNARLTVERIWLNLQPENRRQLGASFSSGGPSGLWDRSSRPRRSPRRTSSALAEEVIALRQQLHPAYRIAQATQLSFGWAGFSSVHPNVKVPPARLRADLNVAPATFRMGAGSKGFSFGAGKSKSPS